MSREVNRLPTPRNSPCVVVRSGRDCNYLPEEPESTRADAEKQLRFTHSKPKLDATRSQQGLVSGERVEVIVIGAKTDVAVGTDDQQRDLAKAELLCGRGREAAMRMRLVGRGH